MVNIDLEAAVDDDYDPRDPKYIIPTTEDEKERISSETLDQQISRLEAVLDRRQSESHHEVYQHYARILAEMRCVANPNQHSHARKHSNSVGQLLPSVEPAWPLVHAWGCSAPVCSCSDAVPEEPHHRSARTNESLARNPGEQLLREQQLRDLDSNRLLGSASALFSWKPNVLPRSSGPTWPAWTFEPLPLGGKKMYGSQAGQDVMATCTHNEHGPTTDNRVAAVTRRTIRC